MSGVRRLLLWCHRILDRDVRVIQIDKRPFQTFLNLLRLSTRSFFNFLKISPIYFFLLHSSSWPFFFLHSSPIFFKCCLLLVSSHRCRGFSMNLFVYCNRNPHRSDHVFNLWEPDLSKSWNEENKKRRFWKVAKVIPPEPLEGPATHHCLV